MTIASTSGWRASHSAPAWPIAQPVERSVEGGRRDAGVADVDRDGQAHDMLEPAHGYSPALPSADCSEAW